MSETNGERRKYDLTGNIPQWIAVLLLGAIGSLGLMIWNSMENRVRVLEDRIDKIMELANAKVTELEIVKSKIGEHDAMTRKVHENTAVISAMAAKTAVSEQTVAQLKASQETMNATLINVVAELKSIQRALDNRPATTR